MRAPAVGRCPLSRHNLDQSIKSGELERFRHTGVRVDDRDARLLVAGPLVHDDEVGKTGAGDRRSLGEIHNETLARPVQPVGIVKLRRGFQTERSREEDCQTIADSVSDKHMHKYEKVLNKAMLLCWDLPRYRTVLL